MPLYPCEVDTTTKWFRPKPPMRKCFNWGFAVPSRGSVGGRSRPPTMYGVLCQWILFVTAPADGFPCISKSNITKSPFWRAQLLKICGPRSRLAAAAYLKPDNFLPIAWSPLNDQVGAETSHTPESYFFRWQLGCKSADERPARRAPAAERKMRRCRASPVTRSARVN